MGADQMKSIKHKIDVSESLSSYTLKVRVIGRNRLMIRMMILGWLLRIAKWVCPSKLTVDYACKGDGND